MNTYEAFLNVRIRAYKSGDAARSLRIFQDAITVTASADYTPEQLKVWARPEKLDVAEWDQSMRRRNSYVALVEDQIAGFSDVSDEGYIDMMYVAPRFSRMGVGRELMAFIEKQARSYSAKQLTSNVSITARPFFEAFGFQVVAEQRPVINGVVMQNFRMTKELQARE